MDAENPTSPRHHFIGVAAALLALLGLYVLSVGPVVYLNVKLRPDSEALGRFYLPLLWAVEYTHLDHLYSEYVSWWESLAGV